MNLTKLDAFLDCDINELTAAEYVNAASDVLNEYKPFSSEMRKAKNPLHYRMRELKGSMVAVDIYIKSGLRSDTKIKIIKMISTDKTMIVGKR